MSDLRAPIVVRWAPTDVRFRPRKAPNVLNFLRPPTDRTEVLTTATRAFSRQASLASLLATCLLLWAGAPTAQALSISNGVGSITVSDSNGGLTNFTVNGADDLFEVIYFYRTSAMSQEAPIAGRFADSVVSSVSQTAADTITVLGGVTAFDYQLDYVLSGGSLSLSLTLDETNGSPLTLSLFSYQDWDVDGPGGGDFLAWDGTVMTVSDPGVSRTVDVTTTTATDATEAAAFGALRNALEDTGVTNLSDGAGLPFGPGDVRHSSTGGSQARS